MTVIKTKGWSLTSLFSPGNVFVKIKSIILSCVLCFALLSCQKSIEDLRNYEEILNKTNIIPEFENAPPVASALAIELLKEPLIGGENIRLVAELDREKVGARFLAININDRKVVLRDDGEGADLRKDDSRFSIFIEDDIDALRNELARKQKELLAQDEIPGFKKRRQILMDRQTIARFDLTELQRGNLFEIPIEIILGGINFFSKQKTLMITDPAVVGDPLRTYDVQQCMGNPTGVWTFGALMRQLASPNPGAIATDAQVSAFVLHWLNSWLTDFTLNDDLVQRREIINNNIIEPWLHISTLSGSPAGQLNMDLAPFQLVAIVNRMDLRGNSGYGMSKAGEGRFIFKLVFPMTCDSGDDPNESSLEGPFLVILEYGINRNNCLSAKAFAQEWTALNTLSLGSAAYNDALEHITMQFTQCGTNTAKPNQSSLNQIRTNEDTFHLGWQLREFELSDSGQLEPSTIQMEPGIRYNGINTTVSVSDVNRLAAYINSHTSSIEDNDYTVPELLAITPGTSTPTVGFLGARAFSGESPFPDRYWDGTNSVGPGYVNSDDARHVFSLNTCTGCHSKETGTSFLHVAGPSLSGFLTGITVTDPAGRPVGSPDIRTFNDLLRRQTDLSNFIEHVCGPVKTLDLFHKLTFDPLRMTH